MAFPLSVKVNVSEIDLTTIVPSVATTEAGIGGVFAWGPVEDRELITSEEELVVRFGKPTSANFETWLTAASFLAYGDKLYVSRAASNVANNAVAYVGGTGVNTQIKNEDHYNSLVASFSANSHYYAKFPGTLGNSLKIAVCDSVNAYNSNIATSDSNVLITVAWSVGSNAALVTANSAVAGGTNTVCNTVANTFLASLSVGDYVTAGNSSIGQQFMKIVSKGTPSVTANATATATLTFSTKFFMSDNVSLTSANTTTSNLERSWEYFNVVDRAPGTSLYVETRNANGANSFDEMHAVVIDEDGEWTGIPNTVLEVFQHMSRATDAKSEQGGSNYYKDVINQGSKYVWWAHDRSGAASALASAVTPQTNTIPFSASFSGGTQPDTESAISISSLARAYDQFKNQEEIDISLLIAGKARGGVLGEQLGNYIIDNICETRKDCVVFISPPVNTVVNNPLDQLEDVTDFRALLRSTSYGVLDSGYKYMYDRYNDTYRWVPLNGDIAGLVVRTDVIRDPWWSPGGFNRGEIKNIVRLAFNPNQAQRDILYPAGVNPVVSFPNSGTILYGDKTLLNKPSAFDRINVRRLFIVLEKAIAIAAKFTLFEFNDEFTRSAFRNLVEPYLRDIQGRRGLEDFRVVCNESNNTAEVRQRKEFRGDIYIKPAYAINFIQLNFVAVRSSVAFDEIIGKF